MRHMLQCEALWAMVQLAAQRTLDPSILVRVQVAQQL